MRRVSGPLLDRIDLRVVMPRMDAEQLVGWARPESSAAVAARIRAAWESRPAAQRRTPQRALRGQRLVRACALDAGPGRRSPRSRRSWS